MIRSSFMAVRSCRVTIQDMDGVSHTVDVTAATLYEAVAQGLAALRGNEWVAGIAEGFNVVRVSVADVRVEHEVKLGDFTKWLERTKGSPREMSERLRIRTILGTPVRRQLSILNPRSTERMGPSGSLPMKPMI